MKSITNELVHKIRNNQPKLIFLLNKCYRKTSVNKIFLTSFNNKNEKKKDKLVDNSKLITVLQIFTIHHELFKRPPPYSSGG